jgi:hypothetical protein
MVDDKNYYGTAEGAGLGTKTASEQTNVGGGIDANKAALVGFADFRAWVNQMIGRSPTEITYNGETCQVAELTADGQLRIKLPGGEYSLVPFNSATIPALLRQWVHIFGRG